MAYRFGDMLLGVVDSGSAECMFIAELSGEDRARGIAIATAGAPISSGSVEIHAGTMLRIHPSKMEPIEELFDWNE